jgi:hypothetical protein
LRKSDYIRCSGTAKIIYEKIQKGVIDVTNEMNGVKVGNAPTANPVVDIDDDNEFDADEFEGVETKQKVISWKPTIVEPIKQTATEKSASRTFYVEILYIIIIVAYILNFIIRKKENERIAIHWVQTYRTLFEQNFSKFGHDKGIILVKESQSRYVTHATGKTGCLGVQVVLNLKRRHDLLSVLWNLYNKSTDTMIMDILMSDNAMDPFVFAIIPRREEKAYRMNHRDVELYTGHSISHSSLPRSKVLITENKDLIPIFLHSTVLQTLRIYDKEILTIHFSDQFHIADKQPKKILRFIFRIPSPSEKKTLTAPLNMAFHFIELVSKTTLSPHAKAKAEQARTKVAEVSLKETRQQREEAAQKRKLEKERKEKERLEKMNNEERSKHEQKLHKKALKKQNAMRVKVIKG